MTYLQTSIVNISSLGDNTVITGVSGQTIQIISMYITFGGIANIVLKSGSSTSFTGPMPVIDGSIMSFPNNNNANYFQTNAGDDFVINLSSAIQAGGYISYFQF